MNVFTVNEDLEECALMKYSEPVLLDMVRKHQKERIYEMWDVTDEPPPAAATAAAVSERSYVSKEVSTAHE